MTDASGLKVKGYRTLIKGMREIGIPDSAIKEAGTQAGNLVLAEARPLVPVRTGRLLSTLKVSKRLYNVQVQAGNNKSVQYANPIHWGWFRRGIKPNPFFAKALGYSRDKIQQTYFEQLEKYITEKTQEINTNAKL